jgi:hypothetical protein
VGNRVLELGQFFDGYGYLHGGGRYLRGFSWPQSYIKHMESPAIGKQILSPIYQQHLFISPDTGYDCKFSSFHLQNARKEL